MVNDSSLASKLAAAELTFVPARSFPPFRCCVDIADLKQSVSRFAITIFTQRYFFFKYAHFLRYITTHDCC